MAERFDMFGITWEPIDVHTEDGYQMTAFHITGNRDGPINVTGPSVVMQHGMGGNSIVWTEALRHDANEPMAFQFAAAGFDIWLANSAGNRYGWNHDTLTIDDKEFWNIDWRHGGVYDTPALVDIIQQRNGGKKVAYVGHSQGTTQAYAGMGLIPEWYDANVSMAVLLGPCTIPNTKYFLDLYT